MRVRAKKGVIDVAGVVRRQLKMRGPKEWGVQEISRDSDRDEAKGEIGAAPIHPALRSRAGERSAPGCLDFRPQAPGGVPPLPRPPAPRARAAHPRRGALTRVLGGEGTGAQRRLTVGSDRNRASTGPAS